MEHMDKLQIRLSRQQLADLIDALDMCHGTEKDQDQAARWAEMYSWLRYRYARAFPLAAAPAAAARKAHRA